MGESKVKTTHLVLILDSSGSMNDFRKEVVEGFNEKVEAIRKAASEHNAEDRIFLTLVTFNDVAEIVRFAQPVSAMEKMSIEEYRPEYLTAMLDAIGLTLAKLEKDFHDSADSNYLVAIWTDGEENASKEYSYAHVSDMMKKRMASGRWTFAYMGANQDLSNISMRLGIPRSNVASFTPDSKGTRESFRVLANSVATFVTASLSGANTLDKFFRDIDEITSVLN